MEQETNGKVQKINDEDYEIIKVIEKETYPGAIRWYQESYGCDLKDAAIAIEDIKSKYGVDHVGLYTTLSVEDVALMYEMCFDEKISSSETRYVLEHDRGDDTGIFKWIEARTGWSREIAGSLGLEGLREWARRKHPERLDNKGCAITLLIAITSTLSIGSLIIYCI